MNIAFIASEVYPFAKTGGLADVSFSLCRALAAKGHKVHIFMPRYKCVDKAKFKLSLAHTPIYCEYNDAFFAVFVSHNISTPTYFIDFNPYFDRDNLYGNGMDYPDNAQRFSFFAHAVIKTMKTLGINSDIIHCNDWHTGLIPLLIRDDNYFAKTASVMTVHNAGYQGIFDAEDISLRNILQKYFEALEYDVSASGLSPQLNLNKINFLKAGVLCSDIVSTVSKKYSKEIQTPEYGYSLADTFRQIADRLHGIPNAIEDTWNPATDNILPQNYSASDMNGKAACKAKLQGMLGLEQNTHIPMLGTISRITYQKGIDVLVDTAELLVQDENIQFVIMGDGDQRYIKKFEKLRKSFPDKIGVIGKYDETTEHLMTAGLDMIVMPSRYEPCGLNQMYSLKYGTIPLVRATGGLDDTVDEWNADTKTGNGFKFSKLNRKSLYTKLRYAISKYKNHDEWKLIQHNAMKFNYSWDKAAEEYDKIYAQAVLEHKKHLK